MQRATYVRLYTDADGESHFEDLEIELTSTNFAPPAAPSNVAQFLPATRSLWVGMPAHWDGLEAHPTPQRQVFCVIQGEYEVTASDGTVRRLPTGSVILLEDTWGKGHSSVVISDEDGLIFGVALAD